ncbi:carboxypeptidase-like regulatory domain-containing protein [Sorangium sp. So ce1097]|uniref:carboxypeptidase-like regulatory domain-containing protein n=1 Tax=Sorangium sp. So ce1097 TaxID=3133330 RepID=UPI003F5EC183
MDEPSDAEVLPGDPRFQRDPALNVDNISAAEEKRSHNMGQNCMGCHQPHGPGKGLFTAAGTVYAPSGAPVSGGTVELRTAARGEGDLVLSVTIDGNGNFFTTEPLPFPDEELFIFLRAPAGGGTNSMPFSTISGACNLCHNEQRRILLE